MNIVHVFSKLISKNSFIRPSKQNMNFVIVVIVLLDLLTKILEEY